MRKGEQGWGILAGAWIGTFRVDTRKLFPGCWVSLRIIWLLV